MPKKFPKFSQVYKSFKRNSLSLNSFCHPVFSMWLKLSEVSISGVRPSPGSHRDLRPCSRSHRGLRPYTDFQQSLNFHQVLAGLKVSHRFSLWSKAFHKVPLRPKVFSRFSLWSSVFSDISLWLRFSSVFSIRPKSFYRFSLWPKALPGCNWSL